MSVPATATDKWTALHAPAHAHATAVARYTREVLLARFHDCLLDPPADLDQSLPIFVQTALDPVANLPLSDLEKKILALGAVHSDISTRRNYGSRNNVDDSNSPAKSFHRHNSGTNVSSRGGRGGFSGGRRHNSERIDRKAEDYESPEKQTAVLNVSSASPTPVPEPVRVVASVEKAAVDSTALVSDPLTSVSENHLPVAAKATNFVPDKPLEFSSPSRHPSSIFDPNIADVFNSMNITSNLSSSPASSFLKQSILGAPAPVPMGSFTDIQAPVRVVSSNWFYKDPMGTIQGPFSTEQMQDWFSKNFFSEDLPIKREQDLAFEPLANLLLRFGHDRPFVNSDETERSVLPAPHVSSRLPSMVGGNGLTETNGYNPFGGAPLNQPTTAANRFNPAPAAPLYGNEFRRDIIFGGIEPAVPQAWGSPAESSNFGLTRGPSTFGQHIPDLIRQQQQYQPAYNPITSRIIPPPQPSFTQFNDQSNPQFGSGVFDSGIPRNNDWVVNTGPPQVLPSVDMLGDGESIMALPVEPQPTKVVEQELPPSPKKAQARDPSPVRKPSPSREPSPITAVREPSPKRPEVVTDAKLKTKKSGQNVKKQVTPVAVPTEPSQQAVNAKASVPATPTSVSAFSAPAVSSSAPAPWAGVSPAKPSVQKMSLKEVQEMEQREAEQRERENARKAHMKIMAEAQALAEIKATNAVVSAGGTVWSSGRTKKKSLAEIMKEEETKKKVTDEASAAGNANSGAAGKRYADSITPSETASVISPAKPPAGWTVVGATGSKRAQGTPTATSVNPVVGSYPSAAAVPKAAVRTVATSSVPATSRPAAENSALNGVSPGFLQWLRQALSPLGRSTTAGVQVDDFIQILLTVPTNETHTISMICDDTLGGLTAIDPIKFADEFVRRRKADALNDPAAWAASSSGIVGKASGEGGAGGFVVVGKKKGKNVPGLLVPDTPLDATTTPSIHPDGSVSFPDGDSDSRLELLRRSWEFAALAQFLTMFADAVDTPFRSTEVRIDVYPHPHRLNALCFKDLEDALITSEPSEMLTAIHVKLLRISTYNRFVTPDSWPLWFRKECEKRRQPALASLYPEGALYRDINVKSRVAILKALTDWQFDNPERFRERAAVRDADDACLWRVEPIGWDARGWTYWLFDDNRLYRERDGSSNGQGDATENGSAHAWELVCRTREDWIEFPTQFKGSKSRYERALYQSLTTGIGPQVLAAFEERDENERQRKREEEERNRQRLIEQERESLRIQQQYQKRSSSRLESKLLDQLERERRDMIERDARRGKGDGLEKYNYGSRTARPVIHHTQPQAGQSREERSKRRLLRFDPTEDVVRASVTDFKDVTNGAVGPDVDGFDGADSFVVVD
ncbi:hypothetical protein HDU83_008934 [Entophlyctis luteolus]|nr:hypothetical protein HDU83_008934 [Entophlyctis luteolus]